MNKQAEELADNCLNRSDFDDARKANFWCIKGDIKDDESFYQKAWELSRGRNAKSMRSLGALLVHRKKYEEAADAFGKGKKLKFLKNLLTTTLSGFEILNLVTLIISKRLVSKTGFLNTS